MIIPANHGCRIPLPLADHPLACVRHGLKNPPPIVHVYVAVNGIFSMVDTSVYVKDIDKKFITINTQHAVDIGGTMLLVEFNPGDVDD